MPMTSVMVLTHLAAVKIPSAVPPLRSNCPYRVEAATSRHVPFRHGDDLGCRAAARRPIRPRVVVVVVAIEIAKQVRRFIAVQGDT